MGEKFNSGNGGYLCDTCRRLLWAGFNGHEQPANRRWWYSSTAETVLVTSNYAFCSELCLRKFNPDGEYPDDE